MNRNRDMMRKLYLTKINRLESNRVEVRQHKHLCVKAQDYETACKLRDREKDIMDMIDRLKKMMKINDMIDNMITNK